MTTPRLVVPYRTRSLFGGADWYVGVFVATPGNIEDYWRVVTVGVPDPCLRAKRTDRHDAESVARNFQLNGLLWDRKADDPMVQAALVATDFALSTQTRETA